MYHFARNLRWPARFVVVALTSAGLLAPCGCDQKPPAGLECVVQALLPTGNAFVGVVGQGAALIGLNISRCKEADRLRAFLTDGTPDGAAEYFEGDIVSDETSLVSASGLAQLAVRAAGARMEGTVKLQGETLPFTALPATEGAGLYEVIIAADGRWTGIGPDGATLNAQQQNGFIAGTIADGAGHENDYLVRDLSQVFEEVDKGAQPDQYLVIVMPRGDSQIGRGGAELKQGVASRNFVRLDLPLSEATPGTFFGQFQDLPDLIGFEFDEPDAAGNRHLRAFVSNAIAPPNGRAEWFSADVTDDFPAESAVLTSISGNAQLTDLRVHEGPDLSLLNARRVNATSRISGCGSRCLEVRSLCLCLFGISGQMQLADGSSHAFYAAPAGEGAGIYEVSLEPGRIHGTSVKGNTLDMRAVGEQVFGTLTTPDGQTIDYQAGDFGGSLSAAGEGVSGADTFVLLVAPRGRVIVGNPGNVHGFLISVEMLFICVILVIGIIGGLSAIQQRPPRSTPPPTPPCRGCARGLALESASVGG